MSHKKPFQIGNPNDPSVQSIASFTPASPADLKPRSVSKSSQTSGAPTQTLASPQDLIPRAPTIAPAAPSETSRINISTSTKSITERIQDSLDRLSISMGAPAVFNEATGKIEPRGERTSLLSLGLAGVGVGRGLNTIQQTGRTIGAFSPEVAGLSYSSALERGLVPAKFTGSTAGQIAQNPKTIQLWTDYIAKVALEIGKPRSLALILAGSIVTYIGTFPFAGFLKEESLQTLGFGINTAIRNNDVEGAERALKFQNEVLDTELWKGITNKIPFKTVVEQLNNFYESARVRAEIDSRLVEDLKIKIETGVSDDVIWSQRRELERIAEQQSRDDWDNRRRIALQEELEAKRTQRIADARFWEEHRKEMFKLEEEERIKIAEFWFEYRKRILKLQEESGRSRLGFGLFR